MKKILLGLFIGLSFVSLVSYAQLVDPVIEPVIEEPVTVLPLIPSIADFFQGSKYFSLDDFGDSVDSDSRYFISHNGVDYKPSVYYWDSNSSSCIDLPEYSIILCGTFSILKL